MAAGQNKHREQARSYVKQGADTAARNRNMDGLKSG